MLARLVFRGAGAGSVFELSVGFQRGAGLVYSIPSADYTADCPSDLYALKHQGRIDIFGGSLRKSLLVSCCCHVTRRHVLSW